MVEFTARVQKLGRIAIPSETREFLSIEEGDIVLVNILRVKKRNGVEVVRGDDLLREYAEHGGGD